MTSFTNTPLSPKKIDKVNTFNFDSLSRCLSFKKTFLFFPFLVFLIRFLFNFLLGLIKEKENSNNQETVFHVRKIWLQIFHVFFVDLSKLLKSFDLKTKLVVDFLYQI